MRSVRTRLLVVSLVVAVVAVVVTAWAVNRATSSDVRDAVTAELEVEEAIYEELSFFAFTNGSWDHVAPVVDGLAREFDERVALTTVDGALIADSAGGEGTALPDEPARFIDPDSPVISFDEPLDRIRDNLLVFREQSVRLAEALEEAGIPFSVEPEDFGLSFPVWDRSHPLAGAVARDFLLEFVGSDELPILDLLADEGAADGDLEVAGEPFGDEGDATPSALEELLEALPPDELFDPEPGILFGLPIEPAPPALLFLGFAGEGETLPDPVGWRLAGIVVGVGLLAVAVAMLASRRLLRPIGALTEAARRMESGDLGERVEVAGGDELAVLGRAFNAMAGSLEEQDRLRRAMTGDIAHELRTPLSNLRGYLEAINDGVLEPTPELMASLHDEAVQLQRLVDDLQDLASAEAGELRIDPAPTDLAALLAGVVRNHRRRAEEAGVELVLEASGEVVAAVDPARIRQVVGNLVDNAVRYTPRGGTVTVSTGAEGDRALVTVADTGAGIEPEHLPHLFDRFYRADPSRSRETGGSGLGLAIAKELVRVHGGDIEVASEPGGGTTFTVGLPLASGDT